MRTDPAEHIAVRRTHHLVQSTGGRKGEMVLYYPMMMDIRQRRCVVIGGGKVAERKAASLLEADGEVTLVSPTLTSKLSSMARRGIVRHLPRRYRKGDLKGAFLCIVATDDSQLQRRIRKEAKEAGALANVADSKEACDFLVPSYFRRGDLLISISTAGKSPALAKRIRRDLESLYGKEYEALLKILTHLRPQMVEQVKEPKRRQSILERAAHPELLEIIRHTDPHCLTDKVWSYLTA